MKKPIQVTQENETGRNQKFSDPNKGGKSMTRPQFVKEIEKGNYPDYHVRKVEGIKTPVSNPNRSEGDNLG